MELKATMGSIDSLSQDSSPRIGALSEDQFSVRSDEGRVKFMCSYGGKIMPRPHDSQLRYVGGETRILVVSRTISLADLIAKLTRISGKSVLLKFQLPDEDLDSLVSVLCEEDLENMMEEYDRLEIRDASARLRLFLFPAKSDGSSQDLQDFDWRNPEQRFVDAVNGFSRRQAQSMPITSAGGLPDFLFGLDVFDRHNGVQSAALVKAYSQRLPAANPRAFQASSGQFAAKDNYLPPSLSFPTKQPASLSLIDFAAPVSRSPMNFVLDPDSPQNVEMINQLSSLIHSPSDQKTVVRTSSDQKSHLLHETDSSYSTGLDHERSLESRKPQEELILLSGPSDHVDPALHMPDVRLSFDVQENQISGADSSKNHDLTVNTSSLPEFRPEMTSNAQSIRHVSQELVLPSLSLLSAEHKLESHVQDHDSNPAAVDANLNPGNLTSCLLHVQKPDVRSHMELLLAEERDLKIQQTKSEILSESRTDLIASYGKAKLQLDLYPSIEEQQKPNDRASPNHIQDELMIKLEDNTEILTVAGDSLKQQYQNLIEPQIVSNSRNSPTSDTQKQWADRDAAGIELPPASAFPPGTGFNSHFPPPTIPRVASAPLPLKSYDVLPTSAHAHGQHIMGALPQSDQLLHRQLTRATDLQQQPFPLPRIKVGQQPTAATREINARTHAAANSRILSSPSRFHEKAPSAGRLQTGQPSVESDRSRMLIRPKQPIYIEDVHVYVDDPSGQLLTYDTSSASQLFYPDQYNQHIPSDLANQFLPFHCDPELAMDDEQLNSHLAGSGLHHAPIRQTLAQAGLSAAEGQRHTAG